MNRAVPVAKMAEPLVDDQRPVLALVELFAADAASAACLRPVLRPCVSCKQFSLSRP